MGQLACGAAAVWGSCSVGEVYNITLDVILQCSRWSRRIQGGGESRIYMDASFFSESV